MCLGVPGKVIEIRDERGTQMATVDFGGVHKDVCLAYTPEASVGDYTVIHAGFAITLLDEASALETLALFDQIGLLEEELGVESPTAPPAHAEDAESAKVEGGAGDAEVPT